MVLWVFICFLMYKCQYANGLIPNSIFYGLVGDPYMIVLNFGEKKAHLNSSAQGVLMCSCGTIAWKREKMRKGKGD